MTNRTRGARGSLKPHRTLRLRGEAKKRGQAQFFHSKPLSLVSPHSAPSLGVCAFLSSSPPTIRRQKACHAEPNFAETVPVPVIPRVERVEQAKGKIFEGLNEKQKEFLDFVLAKYEEKGVEELDEEKLPILLNLKYHAIANAEQSLGNVDSIRSVFFNFQRALYSR